MNSPRVSVCLPNLNNRPFLEERLSTIFDQSFTDWELVIYDNFSDDGAWEFFQQAARSDSRIRIAQAARQGMYANWNNCINAICGGRLMMDSCTYPATPSTLRSRSS